MLMQTQLRSCAPNYLPSPLRPSPSARYWALAPPRVRVSVSSNASLLPLPFSVPPFRKEASPKQQIRQTKDLDLPEQSSDWLVHPGKLMFGRKSPDTLPRPNFITLETLLPQVLDVSSSATIQ